MKRVSFKVAKAIKDVGYPFSYEVNEYFVEYFPTYMAVWLWLWQEKKIYIQVETRHCTLSFSWGDSCTFKLDSNPEEALVAAIEYLVDNDLIKK